MDRQLVELAGLLENVRHSCYQKNLIPFIFVGVALFLFLLLAFPVSNPAQAAVTLCFLFVVECVFALKFISLRRELKGKETLVVAAFGRLGTMRPGGYRPSYRPTRYKPLMSDWFTYHFNVLESWGYSVDTDDDYDGSSRKADYEYWWRYYRKND